MAGVAVALAWRNHRPPSALDGRPSPDLRFLDRPPGSGLQCEIPLRPQGNADVVANGHVKEPTVHQITQNSKNTQNSNEGEELCSGNSSKRTLESKHATETTNLWRELHDSCSKEPSVFDPLRAAKPDLRKSKTGRQWNANRERVYFVVGSPSWDLLMGVIIVLNLAVITWDQSLRLKGHDRTDPQTMEHGFLVLYTLELVARFYVWGTDSLRSAFVVLDCFIVVVGIVTAWVIAPVIGNMNSLGPLFILRIARLLRLVRALRLLSIFRELWMLVRGLMSAIRTMIYTVILLTVMLYAFASIGIEVLASHPLAHDEGEFKAIVDEHFCDLPTAMLTLMQFVTFDNIVYIYTPLIKEDWRLIAFFTTVIMVVGIVLMNLVTAVIVNSALEQAVHDRDLTKTLEEERRVKMVKQLKVIFEHLDQDNSGQICKDEIAQIKDCDRDVLQNIMGSNDPLKIFDALDVNDTGDIPIDEFIEGIWEVVVTNTPIQMKRMEKKMDLLRQQISDAHDVQLDFQRRTDAKIDKVLSRLGKVSPSGGWTSASTTASTASSVDVSSEPQKTHSSMRIAAAAENCEKPSTCANESTNGNAMPHGRQGCDAESSLPHWAGDLLDEVKDICRFTREMHIKLQLAGGSGSRKYCRRGSSVQDLFQPGFASRQETPSDCAQLDCEALALSLARRDRQEKQQQQQQQQQQQGPPIIDIGMQGKVKIDHRKFSSSEQPSTVLSPQEPQVDDTSAAGLQDLSTPSVFTGPSANSERMEPTEPLASSCVQLLTSNGGSLQRRPQSPSDEEGYETTASSCKCAHDNTEVSRARRSDLTVELGSGSRAEHGGVAGLQRVPL